MLAQGSGNTLSFNGIDESINIGNDVANECRTIEMWFKPSSTITSTNSTPVSLLVRDFDNGNAASTDEFALCFSPVAWGNGGQLLFLRRIGSDNHIIFSDMNEWPADRWYHVAVTMDENAGMSMYINGIKQQSTEPSTEPIGIRSSSTSDNAHIGRWGNINIRYFAGEIDEVRLWSTSRTESEIKQKMCSSLEGIESGLKAYYNFDSKKPTTLIDGSLNSSNGDLVNMDIDNRIYSGAPIGDESDFLYNSSGLQGEQLTHSASTGNSLSINSINSTSKGIHIYKVNTLPNLGFNNSALTKDYYGVFLTDYTGTFKLDYDFSDFDCICPEMFTRNDNASGQWDNLNSSNNNCAFQESNQSSIGSDYRGEYIISDFASGIDLGQDTILFAGQNLLLQVPSSGANYLWPDGSFGTSYLVENEGAHWVRAENNGCQYTDTIIVNYINSNPKADILLGDTTICAGTEVQLEIVGDFATLNWSPAETLSCDNCPNPRATPTETTTYTATFEEDGIVQTLSITLTVPVIKAIDDVSVCLNTDVQFDAGIEYDGFIYFWNPSNRFSCTDCPNPTLENGSALATTEVTYGISNGICTLQETFDLTIEDNAGPEYEIIEDARFCLGDDIDLGGTVDIGTTYSWTSDPAGFTSGIANPNVTPTGTTSYFLEATKAGCSITSFDTVHAILTTPPNVNFTTDTYELCEGDTVAITSGLTPESDVHYSWSPNTNNILDSLSLNTSVHPQTTTEYVLTASKGVCFVRDTIDVNVTNISIQIEQGDELFLCKGEPATPLSITGVPLTGTRTWSPAANLSNTTGDLVNLTRLSGAYTVYATVTTGMCSATDSIYVQIDSLPPNREIMPQDTTICEGEFVILSSDVFEPEIYPNLTYAWFPSDGEYQTGDSLYNVVVTPSDTIDYIRYVENGACVDSSLVTVNVQPIEQIHVTPMDTTICQGESFDYQITSPNLMDFMWTPGSGLSCTDCDDPTANPAGSTEYMIEATDNNGCPVMGSAVVNVIPPPTLNFDGSGDICPGQIVVLNTVAIPGITYSWSSNDPDFPDTTDPTPFATPDGNFSYTAVMNGFNCAEVSQTININVIPPADLTITADPTICPGDEITLTAESGGVAGTFNWLSGEIGSSITVRPTMTTDYRVFFNNMCESINATTTVMLEDDITVSIVPDPAKTTVNLGESIDLNASFTVAASEISNVEWFENGNSIGSGNSMNVRPPLEGANEYRIVVTSVNGCTYEGIIVIFAVEPSIVIPDAFTPNNDGLNDELNVVRIVGDIEVNSVSIFDRWGNRVYEAPDGGWDGTFNGKPMPSDVYVILVEILFPDGTVEARKGEVSLIR